MWQTVLSLFVVLTVVRGRIVPETLEIPHGEGFLLRLENAMNLDYQQCQLIRNHQLHSFDFGQNETYQMDTGEAILPFEPNDIKECGVRVMNVSSHSQGHWTLIGGGGQQMDAGTSKITVKGENNRPTKVDQEDLPKESYLNIIKRSTGNRIMELYVGPKRLESCEVHHIVTGKKFKIFPGLLNAYKSDFERGLCQFELTAPIPEELYGIWHMNTECNNHYKRCPWSVFSIIHDLKVETFLQQQKELVSIPTLSYAVTLPCASNAPYVIIECFLLTKSGLRIFDNYQEKVKGNCYFTVREPGNWTCGFNGPYNDSEHVFRNFEVKHYEGELIGSKVEFLANETFTLEVHHIFKEPLKSCIISSPTTMYAIPTYDFVTDKFLFYGGQMSDGDCGIMLPMSAHEQGKWQIYVRTNSDKTLDVHLDL